MQNTLKHPCTHNQDLQVSQIMNSSLDGSPIYKKRGTISSHSETASVKRKSPSTSPNLFKDQSSSKHKDKQPMFSQRKMNEFMNQFYKTENMTNKDVAAVKLESMLTESPTHSNRQSRLTSSPKHIYMPRYNNERSNNNDSS